MARQVEVGLTTPQEMALMSRYGRKRSPKSLVMCAVKEAVAMQSENVAIFQGAATVEARLKAEDEQRRLAIEKEPAAIPPAVTETMEHFLGGIELRDQSGRVVSALIPSTDQDHIRDGLWLMTQFDQDDSEWFPMAVEELSIPEWVKSEAEVPCSCIGEVNEWCAVHGTSARIKLIADANI